MKQKTKPMNSTPAELAAKTIKHRPTSSRRRRKVIWNCGAGHQRRGLGLSLRAVAVGTGVSNPTVLEAELGYDVRLTTATKLAKFFGSTVEAMWKPLTEER